MNKLNQLGDQLQKLEMRAGEFAEKINKGETLTDAERTEMRSISQQIKDIDTQIEDEKAIQDIASRAAASRFASENPQMRDPRNRMTPESEKVAGRFSIARAVQLGAGKEKSNIDYGVEREMSQEGERIARASGLEIQDKPSVFLPDTVFRGSTTTTAADAGNLVPTSQWGTVQGYRPKLILEDLGVTVIDALPGTNNIPVQDLTADAGFVGEAALTPTEPAANIRRPSLSGKAIYSKMTNGWYLQALTGNESNPVLTDTLLAAEGNILNKTIITRGAGTVASKGLMEMDDVVEVTGANGDAVTRALLIQMLNSPDSNNASFAGPAWVTSPSIRQTLQNTAVDAGSGLFLWDVRDPNMLLGHKAAVTTLMPTNLTKGTGGATKRGAVFGHFSELVVMRWPVRQLIINPYSNNDGTEIKLIAFYDWAAKNPKAFVRAFFTTPT